MKKTFIIPSDIKSVKNIKLVLCNLLALNIITQIPLCYTSYKKVLCNCSRVRHYLKSVWIGSGFVIRSGRLFLSTISGNLYSNISSELQVMVSERQERLNNIGKSLDLYLNKVRDYDKNVDHEIKAFELGKRHLANIMGWPVNENITQV